MHRSRVTVHDVRPILEELITGCQNLAQELTTLEKVVTTHVGGTRLAVLALESHVRGLQEAFLTRDRDLRAAIDDLRWRHERGPEPAE